MKEYIISHLTCAPLYNLILTPMVGFAEATGVVSEQALKLLKAADSFVSIPGVGAAAKAALGILSVAQKAKSNRKELVALGEKACTMMTTIIQKVNAAEQPDRNVDMTSLEMDCQDLMLVMEDVQTVVKKCVDRNFLGRMLSSQSDTNIIRDCHDRLDTALDKFTVSSHIETRQAVDNIKNKLDELVEHGGGAHQSITQYAGGNAYNSTENNRVVVTGVGNSVNVSTVAVPPMYYQGQPQRLPYSQPHHSPPQPHYYYSQSSYLCTP